MDIRLILDGPGEGAWNMAVDEALLVGPGQEGLSCLRFYGWREPTLSLGYFQAAADRSRHAASSRSPMIRRATGGGAILHDHELTYSFITSAADRTTGAAHHWYRAFHETLVDELRGYHLPARLCDSPTASGEAAEKAFLCFQRRTDGDVLVGGDKVAGSAQRRFHRGLLQHGSILLKQSDAAPELQGVKEIAEGAVTSSFSSEQLVDGWLRRLCERLDWNVFPSVLRPAELECAERLQREKYGAESWTFKR